MFIMKDVNGDGSCFYRSIYNVLRENNILEKAVNCFLGKPIDEYADHSLAYKVKKEKVRVSKGEEQFVRDILNLF